MTCLVKPINDQGCSLLAVVLAAICMLPNAASAVTFIPVDFPGARGTRANGIDSGTVIGWYDDASGFNRGFIFDGSTYTAFEHPLGVNGTRLVDIAGTSILGSYFDASNVRHGFLFDGSTYSAINVPGSIVGSTVVHAMSGTNIVGQYRDAFNQTQGFIYDGSSYTQISHPTSPGFTRIYGVDGTRVVGTFENSFFTGFSYDGSSYTTILPPGALASMLLGADLDGSIIVGDYADSSRLHGLIYDGYRYSTLDHPLGQDTSLSAIQGNMIVGNYSVGGSLLLIGTTEIHGFIAVVPECSSFLFASLVGTVLVVVAACRRQSSSVGAKALSIGGADISSS